MTALHWAVVFGHTEAIRALLDAGADIEAKDNDGKTPLQRAKILDKEETIDILLDWKHK